MNLVECIREFCEIYDLSVYENYSGRGMFGRTCIGIICDDVDGVLFELHEYVMENCEKCDCAKLRNHAWDNMGLSYIVYFPLIGGSNE